MRLIGLVLALDLILAPLAGEAQVVGSSNTTSMAPSQRALMTSLTLLP